MKINLILVVIVFIIIFIINKNNSKINNDKEISKSNNDNLNSNLKIGDEVYFNPEIDNVCNKDDAISKTGVKSGCMKWYIYKINNYNNYQLILEHNITALVPWNSTGNNKNGMLEAKDALLEDTKIWKKDLNPDLISADDIADITKASRSDTLAWESMKKNVSWFYLDGYQNSNKTVYDNDLDGWYNTKSDFTHKSEFSWLFDNTYNCKMYVCNIEDNNKYIARNKTSRITYGYWTKSSSSVSNYAWAISDGKMEENICMNRSTYGIRPVITFKKLH